MDEQLRPHDAHFAPGPHTELHLPPAFLPLRLRLQPGNVRLEVKQVAAVVGRHSQADVRVLAPEVSRRHCQLAFRDGQWLVLDLQSLNGIYVNGDRVREAVLHDGDRVRVAACTLIIERGTPVHAAVRGRKTDPQIQVLRSIADVLPEAS